MKRLLLASAAIATISVAAPVQASVVTEEVIFTSVGQMEFLTVDLVAGGPSSIFEAFSLIAPFPGEFEVTISSADPISYIMEFPFPDGEVAGGFADGGATIIADVGGGSTVLEVGALGVGDGTVDVKVTFTPIPAALPLLGAGLLGLYGVRRYRDAKAANAA